MSARAAAGSVARYPVIVNTTMTLANTEYIQVLPENCKGFIIHTRDETVFRLAFETGHVATPTVPYFTIVATKAFGTGDVFNYTFGGNLLTLFFASPNGGKVIELIYWV